MSQLFYRNFAGQRTALSKRLILTSLFMAAAMPRSLALEPYPMPREGFCPSGYHASGNYCVPNSNRSGAAIERDGFCPSGYHASGNYCVANNASSGKAIFRNGFCPSGYHASGNYCIEN
jgi:hypothetical protein